MIAPQQEIQMPVFPDDATDVTRLLVVSDLERSLAWYREVLRAEVVGAYGGTSAVLRLVGSWLLLVTGGEPTADKPTVTMAEPADPDRASAELIVAVPDCRAAHAELVERGVVFLADPVEYPWEIRAFFRDPDGHLFEISERKAAPR
jgi:catechol 2,3-dioxygenase-like lactoylglutathione lyase family enzyme